MNITTTPGTDTTSRNITIELDEDAARQALLSLDLDIAYSASDEFYDGLAAV